MDSDTRARLSRLIADERLLMRRLFPQGGGPTVKQRISTLVTSGVLALALVGVAVAGPFDDAVAAYQRGDYAAAMNSSPSSHLPPPSDEWTMRLVFLVPLIVVLCISAFGIGLYAGVKWTWPVPELKGLVAKLTNQATGKDQFGRLLSYPGKTEIACPSQDQMTAVLLVIGQSNAANYQGQRHQSGDDRVINFSAGPTGAT
jgi:hypothetical protein